MADRTTHLDLESRSAIDLRTCGAHVYAKHPTTEILCAAYAIGDEPVRLWHRDLDARDIKHAIRHAQIIVAHGAHFERAMFDGVAVPRLGWPSPKLNSWRCTQAMSLAAALPAKLELAAKALNLPHQKDAVGNHVMMKMAKPRKARKGEDPAGVYWHESAEDFASLYSYNIRDVETERALFNALAPLSDDEQRLWCLDAEINRRGFPVDIELAEAARRIVQAEQLAIDAEISELTGGRVTSAGQVGRIKKLLQERGHAVEGVGKRSVAAVLAHSPADDIRRLLELRQDGGRSAARKLDSLIAGTDADGRYRGGFRFHGASTGRWSGSRFQVQNLSKDIPTDLAGAIEAVRSGDLERVRAFGPPLAVVGGLSRATVKAAKGSAFIGADYSAVESRVLAWLAGEKWKIASYEAFDRTGDPTSEPYCVTATKILGRTVTPEDKAGRAIGKVGDLAGGFGGGVGAWKRFAPDDTRSDIEIQNDIDAWRRAHPAIFRFWHALERKAHRAIRTGLPQTLGNVSFTMEAGTLYMVLPSGRALSYPEAKLVAGKFADTWQISHKDNAAGSWRDASIWYGTLTENLVQAVSRDLLAEVMLRLERGGFPICLHVHDEVVSEMPIGAERADEFMKLFTTLPTWATGLPIAAKGWIRDCYVASGSDTPKPEKLENVEPVGSPPVRSLEAPATQAPPKIEAPRPTAPMAKPSQISLVDLVGADPGNPKVLCPFHADSSPSLHIYDDHYHCFVCNEHGDAVDYLMMVDGKTRDQAVAALEGHDGAAIVRRPRKPAEDPAEKLARAARIWAKAKPITDPLALRYFTEVRKIDPDTLPTDGEALRFIPLYGRDQVPCLVTLFRDVVSSAPAYVQLTKLSPDVFDKAAKVQRRFLGSWPAPCAVKLWPANGKLFLGEGVETVLSAAMKGARPVWAAGPTRNIAEFPVLRGIHLTLLADNDEPGCAAVAACQRTYQDAGIAVKAVHPPAWANDFNDVICNRRRPKHE